MNSKKFRENGHIYLKSDKVSQNISVGQNFIKKSPSRNFKIKGKSAFTFNATGGEMNLKVLLQSLIRTCHAGKGLCGCRRTAVRVSPKKATSICINVNMIGRCLAPTAALHVK